MYLFWRFGVKISFHNDLMDNNIIGITMKAGFVINVIIIFFRCLLFWMQIPDILFSFAPKICQKYLLTPVQCLDKLKACQCLLFFDQFVRVQTHSWLFILSTAELQLCRRTSKYKIYTRCDWKQKNWQTRPTLRERDGGNHEFILLPLNTNIWSICTFSEWNIVQKNSVHELFR